MVKKILVLARKTIKLIILLGISILLIICAVALFFKPIYGVTLNGEQIGYSKDKSKLQAKINKYMESGDGQSNVAFVQMEAMPEYKMCLLKRNIVTNDDEIFETVKKQGITYYNYYAISIGEEIKAYVSDFASAEEIVNQLKEKESTNADEIVITEMYETNLEEFSDVETVVADLYVKKVELPKVAKNSGKVNTSANLSYQSIGIGLNLIRPISGTITSRFGSISRVRSGAHTGLDIAASTGTPIKAAAAGTVTYSGNAGDGYGNYVVIAHANGVQTVYAHCSQLLVSKGQTISQGEVIAKVGSTGNSTGNHLHLEVRKNGITYNPQNYVY